jgi:hypothetical protein
VAAGLPVNPGENLAITVTFRPIRTGRFTAVYRLTWRDPLGLHRVDVTLGGTGTVGAQEHHRRASGARPGGKRRSVTEIGFPLQ